VTFQRFDEKKNDGRRKTQKLPTFPEEICDAF